MLDALCSLGLLLKQQNHYPLKEEVLPYVICDSEKSMRDILIHLGNIRHADKETIKDILRTGRSEHFSSRLSSESFWSHSISSLSSFQQSINNPLILDLLSQLSLCDQPAKLLDLGAGSDALANALINRWPHMDVVLFDLPKCAAVIEKQITSQSGISVICGDYNVDALGEDYDIIWASMSLYYAKDIVYVLSKIKQSLKPSGVFVSYHEALSHARTSPEKHICGRFLASISGNDVSFDDGFIANNMKQVGFKKIQSRTMDTVFGAMRLDICYLC